MTILECKLLHEMKKKGVDNISSQFIINLIKKPKKQKRLMEYLITGKSVNKSDIIYKSLEIAKN